MEYSRAVPSLIRRLIGEGSLPLSTYGWCKGHVQANITMLPSSVANDFERFCKLNPSACPLLYRSKKGEIAAPTLAKSSDIRTQLGKYWHIQNGEVVGELTDLTSREWKDMVTFYLGCSFGMEDALDAAGIKLPAVNNNVSMYISNIPCNTSGPFSTNMVVSMRSVSKGQLQALFEATYKLDTCHGAPIHIGDSSDIGISDINDVDFGEPTDVGENDVPVFFACGVTANNAIKLAGLPQCFSHAPGHMFICDVKTSEFQESHPTPYDKLVPCVVPLCESNAKFSVLSKTAKDKFASLEQLLLYDIGERGVENLCVKDDLLKSTLRLYQASSVGITFGFPVFRDDGMTAEETDGFPGAIAIAKALCSVGKEVSFIIDKRNESLVQKVIRDILKRDIPVLVYERGADREKTAAELLYLNGSRHPRFDHLVSIERTGPSQDGTYRNMTAKTVKENLIGPIEDLFLLAEKDDRISTTSIGDGGNELGMGKVKQLVETHVKHGKEIACVVACNYLITAGVSNWAGYALAVGMHVLYTCPIHMRYVRRGLEKVDEETKKKEDFVNTVKQEETILKMMVDEGVCDGKTGKKELSVDGFAFFPHHVEQIKKFQAVSDS